MPTAIGEHPVKDRLHARRRLFRILLRSVRRSSSCLGSVGEFGIGKLEERHARILLSRAIGRPSIGARSLDAG